MKKGKSIQELAAELDVRAQAKTDIVVPTNEIKLINIGEGETADVALDAPGYITAVNDNAHGEIGDRVGIPRRYYERMLEQAPELLVNNVNHWFNQNPERRMVRMLGDTTRAFLSDRFLRIENEDIARHVFQSLVNHKSNPIPLSMDVTDRKLYLKFLFPDMVAEVKPGDEVKAGISIANSEIGHGSYDIYGFFYRSFCSNGSVYGAKDMGVSLKRSHLGARVIEGVDYQVISDETQKLVQDGLMAQTADILGAVADPKFFGQMVDKLRESTQGPKIINPEVGATLLAKEFGLTDQERGETMVNLIQDGDYSKWGALNAVTKLANETESYDRASELESLGAKILDMDLRRWTALTKETELVAA